MKVDGNKLAKQVTKIEGGKVNLPIAQVKEVLPVVAEELISCHTGGEILTFLERIAAKSRF